MERNPFFICVPYILTSDYLLFQSLPGYRSQSCQDSAALPPDIIRPSRPRSLHGHQSQHLENVILTNILESPHRIIECATTFWPPSFKQFDMNLINMLSSPERFKHSVGETKSQNILEGFFGQIMIYPEYLFFLKKFAQEFVQRLGGHQVIAKRFFDKDAGPTSIIGTRNAHSRRRNVFENALIKSRRNRQVKKLIGALSPAVVNFFELRLQTIIRKSVVKKALFIGKMVKKMFNFFFLELARADFHPLPNKFPELFPVE